MIPKIIHRMWLSKSNEFPSKYNNYRDRLYSLHSDFEIVNWNKDSVEELINNHFPQYKQFYHSLPNLIQKCDFSRYLIMYKYGGVYVDLDFNFYKNISPLLDREILLVLEFEETDNKRKVFNGFFGAIPNHELFINFVNHITQIPYCNLQNDVLNTTGPDSLTRFIRSNNYQFDYVDSCLILPIKYVSYFNHRHDIIHDECVARIRTKANNNYPVNDTRAYDDYSKYLNNYTDTKWIEGSQWQLQLSNKYITIIIIILFVIFFILLCLLT